MSKHFKTILLVRFLGYFVFLLGLSSIVFMLGPVIQTEASYRMDRIKGVKRTVPNIITPAQPADQQQDNGQGAPVDFSSVQASGNSIIPVSTDYGIVIEKINANAKVVPGVNPANEREYLAALKEGVAAAAGSTLPGQPGNLYLFSHSTDAPWNIVRYNAVFYLLRELEPGDKVIIFYQNRRYDYVVFDKAVVDPTDISYLTNKYDAPVLTLQTCDPPGTLLRRLIVRARLINS